MSDEIPSSSLWHILSAENHAGNQEDAHEFMLVILDRINSHLVVDENMTQSAMDKVMATLLSTTVKCSECEQVSTTSMVSSHILISTKVHNVGNECISQELILLCCKDVPTLHRVCNGGKYVQESEIKGNLPDEVVDEDLISIQSYFSKKLLDKKVQAKRTEWKENRMEMWSHYVKVEHGYV
ncbi:uncharacterized protein LOC135339998 isoform X2 [Halichondria panicea]|uniref:uncharacterized protein LOC135339998 isoform X2 n=1 Tax=Halichondria panicea TaxID=6063 RepID=UPI00312B60EF